MPTTRPHRRQRGNPEVIVQLQGQRPPDPPALADAVETTEAEPTSQVRNVFPGRDNVLAIFREAQRHRA